MDIQRVRNLTTHKLHTDIKYVYRDIEWVIGKEGIMTHMLPGMLKAIEPWLRKTVTEGRFWDGAYDTTHIGEYNLPKPTVFERIEMFNLYMSSSGLGDLPKSKLN